MSLLHQSVIVAWHDFSTPLEGRVHSMYCDVLGLVTTGVGNLIDPIRLAEQLPWTLEDGSKADLAQVRADWHALKNNSGYYAKRHWRFARDATKVRLTDEAIDDLVAQKREEFATFIQSHYFNDFASFPADAQLGIMSMAWACGPGFPLKFGTFRRLALAQEWELIARLDDPSNPKSNWSGKIREAGNPGVVPRNKLNRFCFQNAALVKGGQLNPTRLYWPNVASEQQDIESPRRADTVAAQSEAQQALDHFVATERERFLDDGPSAGRDLRDWEEAEEQHDTDPSDLAPESEA